MKKTFFDSHIMDKGDNYMLVNKKHPVSVFFQPDNLIDIASVPTTTGGMKLKEECLMAYEKLYQAACYAGYELYIASAYRSYHYQSLLFDNAAERKGSAVLANMETARPGESEHHTGLALDVTTEAMGYELSVDFQDTPEGRWLAENAHCYGFIIRYPKGKEKITGYSYEPWHLRFVGNMAAESMYMNQLCLEEFLSDGCFEY